MTGVLRPVAGKSIVDRCFFDATTLRRSILVQTFAVRALSLCAIDPFSLYTGELGGAARTGRYT